jgi:hypothetical protein
MSERAKYFLYAAFTLTISILAFYFAFTHTSTPDGSPERAESNFLIYSLAMMTLFLTALFTYQAITFKPKKHKKR